MTKKKLEVGSKVTQMIGGLVPQELKVTEITEEKILCGSLQFDKTTGAEMNSDEEKEAQDTLSYLLLK